jgi:hypothetical protein
MRAGCGAKSSKFPPIEAKSVVAARDGRAVNSDGCFRVTRRQEATQTRHPSQSPGDPGQPKSPGGMARPKRSSIRSRPVIIDGAAMILPQAREIPAG